MFTTASRSLALRALAVKAPAAVITTRALPIRLAPIARSFSVSAFARSTATGTGKKKAKKAAPKKKKAAKKPLTPEQKEKKEIRDLRARALLSGPSLLPESTWSVYLSENAGSGDSTLMEKVKQLSTTFKTISDMELNVSNPARTD